MLELIIGDKFNSRFLGHSYKRSFNCVNRFLNSYITASLRHISIESSNVTGGSLFIWCKLFTMINLWANLFIMGLDIAKLTRTWYIMLTSDNSICVNWYSIFLYFISFFMLIFKVLLTCKGYTHDKFQTMFCWFKSRELIE